MLLNNNRMLTMAAQALIRDHFAVQKDECVLITVDTGTDAALIDALFTEVNAQGARPMVVLIPQLPFQGGLADPYMTDALAAATAASDVWLDFCFPYIAGSQLHDHALEAGRTRNGLISLPEASSFARIYGGVDFHQLMDYQVMVWEFFAGKVGKTCRFTCPNGTDISFTLAENKLKRHPVANVPGMHTLPGAQNIIPDQETVKGQVVLYALFDEIYRVLRKPITLEVDGLIQSFHGAPAEDVDRFDRALRRASGTGNNDYGYCVHFTMGFHPAAQLTGRNFPEDIRIPGSNAIGMGMPWWVPGGGENHPDGMIVDQSMWVGDELIIDAGRVVGPPEFAAAYEAFQPRFA